MRLYPAVAVGMGAQGWRTHVHVASSRGWSPEASSPHWEGGELLLRATWPRWLPPGRANQEKEERGGHNASYSLALGIIPNHFLLNPAHADGERNWAAPLEGKSMRVCRHILKPQRIYYPHLTDGKTEAQEASGFPNLLFPVKGDRSAGAGGA